MEMKKYQKEIIDKHRDLFEFMIIVCRRQFKMNQVTKILIQTGYCRDKSAVSRLFKEFRECEVIYDRVVQQSKLVQIPMPVVKYVMGDNVFNKKSGSTISDTRTEMAIALFRREYLAEGRNLKTSMELMKNDGFNLFTSSQKFYDMLNHQTDNYASVAYCSFNNKVSKFFRQEREMKKRLRCKRENLKATAHQKGNSGVSYNRKYWILDDFKSRCIFFKNLKLNKVTEPNEWIKMNLEPYQIKPYTLELNFIYLTHEWNPNEDTIFKQVARLYRYIRESFKFHHIFFLQEKQIKTTVAEIVVNVEIVTLNNIAKDHVRTDKIAKKMERIMKKSEYLYDSYKYHLNVSCIQLDLNDSNEHLLPKNR